MKKLLLLSALALALASCITYGVVPHDRVLLGSRYVGFSRERDAIDVGNYEGRFRSLYFEVERNDIEIFNIVIVYGNGERERVETRLVFDQGTRSRIIGFEGGERRIRAVEFSYKTVGTWLEGRARILVYGLR